MKNIKKEVREKIKEYSNKKYLDGYIKQEFLTDNHDANIYIKLNSKDELFDSRTIENQKDLNSNIYEFLDSKSAILSSDIQINFYVLGLSLSNEEKDEVKNLIKEHYAIEFYKKQKEHKRVEIKVFRLLLIGIVFTILYALTLKFSNYDLFNEILLFIASFSIWEAFDFILYDLIDIKREREVITQKLLIDTYFSKEEGKI